MSRETVGERQQACKENVKIFLSIICSTDRAGPEEPPFKVSEECVSRIGLA